ncbi:hypothetical protein BsWGS_27424 [Bradybaena similaris]
MSVDGRSSDRRRYSELQAREKEIAAGLLKTSLPSAPKAVQENEKRIRREIANSNERRRMQCINAGFSSLRALIPHLEGEKLSKAAILQQASEHICSLEQEKSRLQLQLDHTKGLLSGLGQERLVTDAYVSSSPPPSKRKKRDTESSDEGVCSLSDGSEDSGSELQQENMALRHQLELERQRFAALEQHNRLLEAQFLTLLHSQAPHHSPLNELRPVSLDHRHLHQTEPIYEQEMIDHAAPQEIYTPQYDNLHPPHRSSPKPERVAKLEISEPLDTASRRPLQIDSSYRTPESVSFVPTVEAISELETRVSAVETISSSVIPVSTDQQTSYCHRDHPRRRHRHQAQLEQQREEEELRRRQDDRTVHEQVLYHRTHNTQNLEKLVEAIRQIEGDRMLSKFNEDEHKQFDKGLTGENVDESEREISSDQDEPKSESSGRDSPLQHHYHHDQYQKDIGSLSGNAVSDKHPVASTLLQCPVNPSYYRPGVIVHKL